jgi:hypothetical protein
VKVKAVHFNPPGDDSGKTRCGRSLRRVLHTTDPHDITCNACARLLNRGIDRS